MASVPTSAAVQLARRRGLLGPGILLAVSLLAGAALIWTQYVAAAPSRQRATAIGLAYARNTMVWERGPTLVRDTVVPLRRLQPALDTARILARRDVNVPRLIRRYGADRRVDLVIVRGKFNTLPPDEGLIVTADVVTIVDMQTGKVLLMTD